MSSSLWFRTDRFLSGVSSKSEVVAAIIVLAVILVMILPLPVWFLDVLIGFNISISALLLIITIYLPNPLALSSFPSILLFTTLLRLSLSVSTTRQILLIGDAGHIVDVFGNFVAGGNLVVGMVIFFIITVVNFLVVTKGSERVAEVAARFTLDGMPGKQMSIDSDLRAGLIDQLEARRRRTQLEKESQLFGAMDGAMKFVKGDAIAGIIIIFVNLLGGLAVGTLQRDMTFSNAAQIYSILSIGDGLVAQIPSLLISVAAGMMITRVGQDDKPSSLGKDIFAQMVGQPRAVLTSGLIVAILGLIPGMPFSVFLTIALILAGSGFYKLKYQGNNNSDHSDINTGASGDEAVVSSYQTIDDVKGFSTFRALHLEFVGTFASDLVKLYVNAAKQARNRLVSELGAPIPVFSHRLSASSAPGKLVLYLFNVPTLEHVINLSQVCVRESSNRLKTLGVEHTAIKDEITGLQRCWVDLKFVDHVESLGLTIQDDTSVFIQRFEDTLRKNMNMMVGIQESVEILRSLEVEQPELVREFNRVIPGGRMAEVLQRLLSEGVSIRNMRGIVQSLIEWGPKERDVVTLAEHVRVALKNQICYSYAQEGILYAILISETLEELIRSNIRQTSMGNYLSLDPVSSQDFIDKITNLIVDHQDSAQAVLVVPMDLRRYIRRLLETTLFRLPVMSFNEVLPELSVQTIALIE